VESRFKIFLQTTICQARVDTHFTPWITTNPVHLQLRTNVFILTAHVNFSHINIKVSRGCVGFHYFLTDHSKIIIIIIDISFIELKFNFVYELIDRLMDMSLKIIQYRTTLLCEHNILHVVYTNSIRRYTLFGDSSNYHSDSTLLCRVVKKYFNPSFRDRRRSGNSRLCIKVDKNTVPPTLVPRPYILLRCSKITSDKNKPILGTDPCL